MYELATMAATVMLQKSKPTHMNVCPTIHHLQQVLLCTFHYLKQKLMKTE